MAGGITYGVAKSLLARAVDNGVCADDARVLPRVNEATHALLMRIIPVGGMMTVDLVADGTTLLLPKEMENAIEVEVLGNGDVRGNRDVRQGWYDIVNRFTYVDPTAAHDNPLVDLFLVPDPADPTILRRKYDYPGISIGATVRVTGAKRFLPITSDADYLIIQNIRALKLMITAIEREENNAFPEADAYLKRAVEELELEVKKHQLDPRNSLKRKAGYDADLVTFQPETFGYVRARLAFDLPGGLSVGKSELTRLLEQAEQRAIDKGTYVGTLEEYSATVTGGRILAPAAVKSIVAADLCGMTLDVRSIFFQYQHNGPGHGGMGQMLIDEGERTMADGTRRRQYCLGACTDNNSTLTFVAKLRWMPKTPAEKLTIRNYEAIRLLAGAILLEKADKLADAGEMERKATAELDRELREYLSGIAHTFPQQTGFIGTRDLGGVM